MHNLIEPQRSADRGDAPPDPPRVVVEALERENRQLREALSSRIAIEQAKGVLVERFDLTPDRAFDVLRRAARNTRQPLQTLAAIVTATRTTPPAIDAVMSRNGRRRERLGGS